MPLYEYKCEKCGHKFEKIEPYSASTVKKCPECGARAERQVSAAGIQFKGSGWYVTDYKGKSPGSGTSSEGGTGDSKSGGDSKSSDSGSSSSSDSKSSGDSKSSDSKSTDSSKSSSSESKSSSEKSSKKKK